MSYESIVLELMSRIKVLEEEVRGIRRKIEIYETQHSREENENQYNPPEEIERTKKKGTSYGSMTDEMIEICYGYGKKLHENPRLDLGGLADEVARKSGMNRNSAYMYIYVVDCMLKGEVYKRAINTAATRAYLGKIHQEQGPDGLKKALGALDAHIAYRQGLGHTVDGLIMLSGEYTRKLR